MSRRHELRRQWTSDCKVLECQGAKPIAWERWAVYRPLGSVETAVEEGAEIRLGGLSSIAGEDLNVGDTARLGEDGRIYRVGSTKGRLAATAPDGDKPRKSKLARRARRWLGRR